MKTLDEKFRALEADNAPGQEVRQETGDLNALMRGEILEGVPVDFSHGDVDAFPPTPGSEKAWKEGFEIGGHQAYTEYRGATQIREGLAERLGTFTGRPVEADRELIITPGTQGALFLALCATVTTGTKVAVVEPDYFTNRKLVKFFGGEHEVIRDELLEIIRAAALPCATPQAGSYLFPQLPPLVVDPHTFVRLLRHQAGVTVTPGTEFAPGSGDSIRLNFSQDHAAAVAAAGRIVKMVNLYRK